MTFSPTFGRVFSPTFKPHSLATSISSWAGTGTWWLTGGIDPANSIAAYEAKNAPSYLLSKTNLANPGTYDAAAGADPAWDATDGWTFNGSTHYLTTGIVPASGWSMIVRFSNLNVGAVGGTFLGTYKANARFEIGYNAAQGINYCSGQYMTVVQGTRLVAGVLAVAGQQGYLNGSTDGAALAPWAATNPPAMLIGDRADAEDKLEGKIQVIAIYNATLTGTQIGLLTTAMNAL